MGLQKQQCGAGEFPSVLGPSVVYFGLLHALLRFFLFLFAPRTHILPFSSLLELSSSAFAIRPLRGAAARALFLGSIACGRPSWQLSFWLASHLQSFIHECCFLTVHISCLPLCYPLVSIHINYETLLFCSPIQQVAPCNTMEKDMSVHQGPDPESNGTPRNFKPVPTTNLMQLRPHVIGS
ncbi:hypothetical protein DFH06DRAFT_207942 [Mycena polygramma]|nr:hypothetical protein DFH06DRAFT_207942 [Mycena polygramma]